MCHNIKGRSYFKMKQILVLVINSLLIVSITSIISTVYCEKEGRRLAVTEVDYHGFKSPCGSPEQVGKRVGQCLVEVLELIYGRVPIPKGDQEMVAHCNRFATAEKCIKASSRECFRGLHKTAVGAIASASKRFRAQSCKSPASRARYIEPIKCLRKKSDEMIEILKNRTGVLQGIRDLNIQPELKLVKMCCLLDTVDVMLRNALDTDCPNSTELVLGIFHALVDDARSTLCIAPKCNGVLTSVANSKYQQSQNLVEPIMQILFQINTEER